MDELDNLVSLRLITHNVRLVKARKERGLTQPEMAELVGTSQNRLSQIETLKRLPSDDEMGSLAAKVGRTIDYLFPETLMDAIRGGVFDKRYRELGEVEVISLGEAEMEQLSYDGESVLIEAVSQSQLRDEVSMVIDTLRDPRAKQVLIRRFGLDGDGSHTLEEVGVELNVTRERVRQVEAKALRALRHPSRSRRLKGYLQ